MPVGHPKYYYFELSAGICRFKFHADSQECFEFAFCDNVPMTKQAILKELFGETSFRGLI